MDMRPNGCGVRCPVRTRISRSALLVITSVGAGVIAAAGLPSGSGQEFAADSAQAKPAFEQLIIQIEPFGRGQTEQAEELRIEATGRLWYKVEGRDAQRNVPARSGAVFHHELSAEHIRRLNRLLEQTQWLAAEGAEGPATHTHPTTVTLILSSSFPEILSFRGFV
jgi:hypothetical protein